MKKELENQIAAICQKLFDMDLTIELTRPEEKFGDYSTNVALQLAKRLSRPSMEVSEQLAASLREDLNEFVRDVSVAGPGFVNLTLKDQVLHTMLQTSPAKTLNGTIVVAEYSDPNPFKVLHAGHLYTTIVGDAIARFLESAGATVHRINYAGDVGLHVAKAMWSILGELGGESKIDKLKQIEPHRRSDRRCQPE